MSGTKQDLGVSFFRDRWEFPFVDGWVEDIADYIRNKA